ncbi:MAG: peroxiredoxin [Thermoplasmatota archaeon]
MKVGDRVQDFTLKDHSGVDFRMADHLGKGPIVLYFYPKDDSPGCTVQACAFRDSYEDFKDAGAEVIGISSDSERSHLMFVSKHSLPFTLLSDKDGAVRKLFGVPRSLGLLPGRVTYVIDSEGTIRYIFSSQSRVREHISRALETLRNMR